MTRRIIASLECFKQALHKKTASEAYLGKARARAYKVVENFERLLAEGKHPRMGEEHRIVIYQYLLATENFRDLDLAGAPINVGGPAKEVPRLLKVVLYAATQEDHPEPGVEQVYLDTLDHEWMSAEGKLQHVP